MRKVVVGSRDANFIAPSRLTTFLLILGTQVFICGDEVTVDASICDLRSIGGVTVRVVKIASG